VVQDADNSAVLPPTMAVSIECTRSKTRTTRAITAIGLAVVEREESAARAGLGPRWAARAAGRAGWPGGRRSAR